MKTVETYNYNKYFIIFSTIINMMYIIAILCVIYDDIISYDIENIFKEYDYINLFFCRIGMVNCLLGIFYSENRKIRVSLLIYFFLHLILSSGLPQNIIEY